MPFFVMLSAGGDRGGLDRLGNGRKRGKWLVWFAGRCLVTQPWQKELVMCRKDDGNENTDAARPEHSSSKRQAEHCVSQM